MQTHFQAGAVRLPLPPLSVLLGAGAVASKAGQEAEPRDVTNLLHFKVDLQCWASGPASTQPSVGRCSQGQLLHMAISSHIC